jgi:hypothetical protein
MWLWKLTSGNCPHHEILRKSGNFHRTRGTRTQTTHHPPRRQSSTIRVHNQRPRPNSPSPCASAHAPTCATKMRKSPPHPTLRPQPSRHSTRCKSLPINTLRPPHAAQVSRRKTNALQFCSQTREAQCAPSARKIPASQTPRPAWISKQGAGHHPRRRGLGGGSYRGPNPNPPRVPVGTASAPRRNPWRSPSRPPR